MADQGGFFITFPTANPLGAAGVLNDDQIFARQFTCPGSGAQDINEIGFFVNTVANNPSVRFLIYNDDGADPGSNGDYVTNSLTGDVAVGTADNWTSHTYSPKPQCTGGVEYWLAVWGTSTGGAVDLRIERFSFSGGVSSITAQVYDADPPASESWAAFGYTFQLAAEYQAAAGGGNAPTGTISGPLFGPLGGPV